MNGIFQTPILKFGLRFGLALIATTLMAQAAFAACYGVSCAAICRYTCQFEVTGTCTDQQKLQMVQQCCSEAFSNTAGINDVPCGEQGGT